MFLVWHVHFSSLFEAFRLPTVVETKADCPHGSLLTTIRPRRFTESERKPNKTLWMIAFDDSMFARFTVDPK